MTGDRLLLSSLPPSARQQRMVAVIAVVLVATAALTAPFARIGLNGTEILLPAYATAVLLNDLLTAALLFVLYDISRTRALVVVAVGYLFTGLMVIPWAMTFPGVFPSIGPLNAGLQSTAWIAAVRRLVFPAALLAYALLDDCGEREAPPARSAAGSIGAIIAAVIAAAVLVTWLIVTADSALPAFMNDARQTTALWIYVPVASTALAAAALSALLWRRRSMLDLWLAVVLVAFLMELTLISFVSSGRFSLGWWAGRLYGLLSASIVLSALLAETAALYSQLARSVAAEHRAREAQLTRMEALSAAIAHEVNQPLASMVTNADAGLRWLDKPVADLDEARAALRRIVADGHRAGDIVASIRTMIRGAPQERVPLDMNGLIGDVVSAARREASLDRARIETDLEERLPSVVANPVQLRQVVANLIANAVQALGSAARQDRLIRIISASRDTGTVVISVEDGGIGLPPALREQIFEPFFTTKAHGMGLGLMFCRSVVEAHGGRLWASDRLPQGAVFHFSLPGIPAES